MSEPVWPYYPVFLRLEGARVLLVGGGEVAARKLGLLLRAGADVGVVARDLGREVAEAVEQGRARVHGAHFEERQIAGCRLVVAATDDPLLNARVAAGARAYNVPVNVVDDEVLSTYITPAIVDRAPLLVAISSGGAAPVLARRLRERIESQLPAAYGRLASFMQRHRDRLRVAVATGPRRQLWERFLDGTGAERVLAGDESGAEAVLAALQAGAAPVGEVYLVGAGPGDPDLLNFRALRLMQQCDVVLYDRLVSTPVLDLVRRDAQRLFVGKARSHHAVPQEEINAELVRLAKAGKRVLRLKGGDPFIFGRGGEEIETLMAEGIAFQVVPGITAASGCAAYAGIPLTHRDYAQSCIFVTGHARADGELKLHWDQLARPGQTVVFYMGLNTLAQTCTQLQAHGLPADWPAALVSAGTRPEQTVVVGDLASLPAKVEAAAPVGASLLIVGEVVRLRQRLNWFRGGSAAQG